MTCACVENYICRACRNKSESWLQQEVKQKQLTRQVAVVLVAVVVVLAGFVMVVFRVWLE